MPRFPFGSARRKPLPLALKVLVAILLGVGLGYVLLHGGVVGAFGLRLVKTLNVFFAQMLRFIVPLLILGLVTPSITEAGRGAGRLLAVVMALSYVSTCVAALFGYFAAGALLPLYVAKGAVSAASSAAAIQPFIDLKIPPVCDTLTALALSFVFGIGIVATGARSLKAGFDEFAAVIRLTILRVIIPVLPAYILTMLAEMSASGRLSTMAGTMVKVIGTGWALTIVFLILLYVLAGVVARRNPLVALWNMAPAYLTGLSISSSSAVIPVTLACCAKNGVSPKICNFVVPLCANVHMVGSAIKLMASALAVALIYDIPLSFGSVLHFTFLFAMAAVAAPGVMSGVLLASLGFVESILRFTPEQIAVTMTFYMALDGYGPAANVTGDGAIALVVDRWFGEGRASR